MRSIGEGVVMAERFSATKRGLLRQFIHWLDSKARSREELIALCLERIAARDAQLKAWVDVSPQPELDRGPLNGIPFGAKDIFETLNLATEYGSPLYAGRKGSTDAGRIMEPSVCVPNANGTMPAATATAEPLELPPGVRAGS